MKKAIALLLAMFMLFALCSCGGKDKDTVLSSSSESVSSKDAVSAEETKTSSEETEKSAKAVTRYYLYGPGKSLKTTYEYSNNMKISAEYYYEEDTLRSTVNYQYNESGVITSKTVENVGEAEVYKWDYARNGDKLFAIYISTPSRPNFEGYNFADNANGKLYQKVHIVNGISNDYWAYDYDADGDCIYRGYYDVQHSLVEYYEFKYGEANELAAKAFKGTGILD